GKEKLPAKLRAFGSETVQADFGDPVAGSTRYDVCIYDGTDALAAALAVDRAAATGRPQAQPWWKDERGEGGSYKTPGAAASGARTLSVAGGTAGKGKVQLRAGNNAGKGQSAL